MNSCPPIWRKQGLTIFWLMGSPCSSPPTTISSGIISPYAVVAFQSEKGRPPSANSVEIWESDGSWKVQGRCSGLKTSGKHWENWRKHWEQWGFIIRHWKKHDGKHGGWWNKHWNHMILKGALMLPHCRQCGTSFAWLTMLTRGTPSMASSTCRAS